MRSLFFPFFQSVFCFLPGEENIGMSRVGLVEGGRGIDVDGMVDY